MLEMTELSNENDIDAQIRQAQHEARMKTLDLEVRKKLAVLEYIQVNAGVSKYGKPRWGQGLRAIAAKYEITFDQLRLALRKYNEK